VETDLTRVAIKSEANASPVLVLHGSPEDEDHRAHARRGLRDCLLQAEFRRPRHFWLELHPPRRYLTGKPHFRFAPYCFGQMRRVCQSNSRALCSCVSFGCMCNPFRYFNSSPEVIRLVVMMYERYPLSLRNIEDLLAERGIDVSHETVGFWWNRFGPMFAAEIRKRRVAHMRGFIQWRWHLDEAFVKINGKLRYLWRAVDHEGEVLEAVVTSKRDKAAALKLLKRIMKKYGSPRRVVTDGLILGPIPRR
jgi:DDE domain